MDGLDLAMAMTDGPSVAAIAERVRALQGAEGKSMKDLASEAGIAYGTFTSVLGGTYQGRVDDYLTRIETWLVARQAKGRMASLMPTAPGFVETPSAAMFLKTLEHAQYMPDFCVITGAPGVGKTSSAREYRARNANVWLLTGEPCGGSARNMLEDIGAVMAIPSAGYSAPRLSREIAKKARGSNGLLIVDEAQHLASAAFDQLRTLFDMAEVGVALLGNPAIYGRLEGGTRSSHFAQLFSRVGMRTDRLKPDAGDIGALLDAWKISDPGLRKMLGLIARKPGALRGMTKTLRLAHMLATGDGSGVLASKHVEGAWQRLSGQAELVA